MHQNKQTPRSVRTAFQHHSKGTGAPMSTGEQLASLQTSGTSYMVKTDGAGWTEQFCGRHTWLQLKRLILELLFKISWFSSKGGVAVLSDEGIYQAAW